MRIVGNEITRRIFLAVVISTTSTIVGLAFTITEYKSGKIWAEPAVVEPGSNGNPPSDAVVLFNGKDMSAWKYADDWEVKDGAVTVDTKHTGEARNAETKESFGNCQLHVEWSEPMPARGTGQQRGNSGVFLMGRYEVQVLDSYKNKTYFDGQCGAIYKQYPPLVNVCKKPEEWQTYDIIFEAPKFDADRQLIRPAYITVLQNGVVVQNHAEILGFTSYDKAPEYNFYGETAPLQLQNHGDSVKFRNIWIRKIPPQTFTWEKQHASNTHQEKNTTH